MTSESTKAFLAKYRHFGAGYFFHDPIEKMDRDELLGLIGWMCEDKKSTVAMRDDHISFLNKLRTGKSL